MNEHMISSARENYIFCVYIDRLIEAKIKYACFCDEFMFNYLYSIQFYICREMSQKGKEYLLVQCNTGDKNFDLIECARHCIEREVKSNSLDVCVLFLVNLSRVSKSFFSGFQVKSTYF